MSEAESFLALRPRLRGDSSIFPAGERVVLENDTQSFGLSGEGLYPLLAALLPLLDGEHTVAEILDSVPQEIRHGVRELLELLLERTILVAQPEEEEVELPSRVRQRFTAQIDLLTHLVERPLAAFRDFRQARVLLAGGGPAWDAAAAALLRYGLGHLDLVACGPETERGELEATTRDLRDAGLDASTAVLATDLRQIRGRLGELSLVIYLSDRSALRDVVWLNRECDRLRRPWLPGVVFGDRSLLGPLMAPPAAGCWVCGLCRQAEDVLSPEQAREFHRETYPPGRVFSEEPEPEPRVARLLGRDAAFEAFKLLAAEARAESRRGMRVTVQDRPGGFQTELVPYPLCGCMRYCEPFCSE